MDAILVLLFFAFVYFMPTIIAMSRDIDGSKIGCFCNKFIIRMDFSRVDY